VQKKRQSPSLAIARQPPLHKGAFCPLQGEPQDPFSFVGVWILRLRIFDAALRMTYRRGRRPRRPVCPTGYIILYNKKAAHRAAFLYYLEAGPERRVTSW